MIAIEKYLGCDASSRFAGYRKQVQKDFDKTQETIKIDDFSLDVFIQKGIAELLEA